MRGAVRLALALALSACSGGPAPAGAPTAGPVSAVPHATHAARDTKPAGPTPTEGGAASRLAADRTVDVYCHDTMYVIDLARLKGTPEKYEAAKAIVRCVQERDAGRCPDVCESLRLLFRQMGQSEETMP